MDIFDASGGLNADRAVNPSPPTDGLRFHELEMRWSTSRSAVGCGCNLARRGAVSSSLLEHRPAGFAQAGLLPPKAGDNGPHIWDLAWAKTIDVGGAGLSLLRRCLRSQRGCRCEQCERQSKIGAARDSPGSGKPCLHDSPSDDTGAGMAPSSSGRIRQKLFANCDFPHIWSPSGRHTLHPR